MSAAAGLLAAFTLVAIEERRFPDGSWDVRGWLQETACEGVPYAVRAFFVEGLGTARPRLRSVPLRPTVSSDDAGAFLLSAGRPPLGGEGPVRFGVLAPLPPPPEDGELSVSIWPPARTEVQLALSADVTLLPRERVPSEARPPSLPDTRRSRTGALPGAARAAGLEAVQVRAEGGGCIPLRPCTLWLRFQPPVPPSGGRWRAHPLSPRDAGRQQAVAVFDEVEPTADAMGLQRVRLRMTVPEGSVRWGLARRLVSDVPNGAEREEALGPLETTLPARWGVPWVERASRPWVSMTATPKVRGAPGAEEGVWALDGFVGGCWAWAGELSVPSREGVVPLHWVPSVPGLWRMQFRRHPTASEARVLSWVVLTSEGEEAATEAWRVGLHAAAQEGDAVAAEWLRSGPPMRDEGLVRQLRFVLAGEEGRQEPLPLMRSAWSQWGPRFREALRAHRRRVAWGLMGYGVLLALGMLWGGSRRGRSVREALIGPERSFVVGAFRRVPVHFLAAGLLLLFYGFFAWLLAGGGG